MRMIPGAELRENATSGTIASSAPLPALIVQLGDVGGFATRDAIATGEALRAIGQALARLGYLDSANPAYALMALAKIPKETENEQTG